MIGFDTILGEFTREILEFPSLASFPVTGKVATVYIALDTGLFYSWNGTEYLPSYEIPDNNIIVVTNYAALPLASTVPNTFYWCSNSQGTSWLPGSLGGTYYPKGIYYSNGTTWEHIETPYQATQVEVDAGIIDNKFVTPKTLNDWEIPEASTTVKGIVNISTQSFKGNKTIVGESDTVGNAFEVKNLSEVKILEVKNNGDISFTGYNNSQFNFLMYGIGGQIILRLNPPLGVRGYKKTLQFQDQFEISTEYHNNYGLLFSNLLQLDPYTKPSIYINGLNGKNVGFGTITPHASAIIDTDSTTQGSLPFPRMTQAQRIAITSPAIGLCVYQTDATSGIYVNTASGWVNLGSGGGVTQQSLDALFEKNILRQNLASIIPLGFGNTQNAFGVSDNISAWALTLSGNTVTGGIPGFVRFVTTATAGTLAWRKGSFGLVLGNINYNYVQKLRLESNLTGQRGVWGLGAFTYSSPTNVEPNTITNIIGICQLSTSSNLHILHNDGSGLATTIDLGVNYPCGSSIYTYYIDITRIIANANYIIKVTRVTNADLTEISTTQTISSNIPVAVSDFSPINYITNNAQTSIASYFDGGCICELLNQ